MDKVRRFCLPYSTLTGLRLLMLSIMFFVVYNGVDYFTVTPGQTKVLNFPILVLMLGLDYIMYFVLKNSLFVSKCKIYDKRIEYYKKVGATDLITNDFRHGEKALGGNLIIGEYCLIGYNFGVVVFYDEIQRIYTAKTYDVKKSGDNPIRESNHLCVTCSNGEKHTLCLIPGYNNYYTEVGKICNDINDRNSPF